MPQVATLNEHAKSANDLDRAAMELFSDTSDILAAMPWESIDSDTYRYILEDALPGIAFRGINESFTPDIGVENPQVESLFLAGGEIDVDNFLLKTQGQSRRAREETKKMKKMARAVTDAILAGNNSVNPREFDGLQRRLVGKQLLHNSTAVGGAGLSLSALDRAISATVEPTHIICPKVFRDVLFPAVTRNQDIMGNAQIDTKAMDADPGRKVTTYNGYPLLVGYETGPDEEILPFTEIGEGGGAAETTSIYVVSFKEGHLWGIQESEMEMRDIGELESKPAERSRLEWYPGLVLENPYAATRLTSVSDEPITA